tara:strand:- start:171 stop:443 length:273 start_codon:yes stop_codon:yes gene_type:complete
VVNISWVFFYVVLDVGTSIKSFRRELPGLKDRAGLAGVVGVGNARLFNARHELLCQFFQAHKYLMLKIKYNAQRYNVQGGGGGGGNGGGT